MRNHGKLSGSIAAKYGCIATFENSDGLVMARHCPGQPTKALRQLCDHAESIDPTYRLVCCSTPQGIIADIEGRGVRYDRKGRQIRFPSPEKTALSRSGRAHMAHPRLGA